MATLECNKKHLSNRNVSYSQPNEKNLHENNKFTESHSSLLNLHSLNPSSKICHLCFPISIS